MANRDVNISLREWQSQWWKDKRQEALAKAMGLTFQHPRYQTPKRELDGCANDQLDVVPSRKAKRKWRARWASVQKRLSKAVSGKIASDAILAEFGYTGDQVRAHLERQFKVGMSWDNYAGNLPWKSKRRKWHIDHIVPKKHFDKGQLRDAYALSNLRPLWEADNLRKAFERQHLI